MAIVYLNPDSFTMLHDIFSTEYVNDMIYDHPERLSKLSPITQLLNLELNPQIVFTIIFDNFWSICETKDNAYRYRLKRLLLDTVRSVLKKDHRAIAATLTGTDKVVVLLDCQGRFGSAAEEYACQCASELLDKVTKKTGYSITIGVSSFCAAPPLLYRAYEQSFRALEQSFQAGPGQILCYRSPSDKNNDKKADSEQSLPERSFPEQHSSEQSSLERIKRNLIIAVTTQNAPLCTDTLDQLSAELSMQTVDSFYIKSLTVSILSEIAGYCVQMGLEPKDTSKQTLAVTGSVFKSNSMSDVKKEAYEFLHRLAHRLGAEAPESTPLDMAAAFLELYYMKNPSLMEMASFCGYSTSYFSRAFKERFGINFVRYLKALQIKNAKKLLCESELNLSEICEKTGFQSVSYFSSNFKKETGLSPSQYRISFHAEQ